MDINILLALQEFRNTVGGFLAGFMEKMTFLGELNTALLILAVVYWCFSKETGSYLLMGWSGNRLVNGVLKVTACVYRPWIRDSRIIPYGDAMTTATGYSFPSGHTMNAATIFGGITMMDTMPLVVRVVSLITVFLVGFSRNYLGVHTPQDVLVGSVTGLVVMWLIWKLMNLIKAHPEKDVIVLCVGLILCVTVALYAGLKSYPEDYDAAGKLIVDGAKMANDTFKGVGWSAAFLTGWFLERRFVGFSTDVPNRTRVTRLVTGMLCFFAVSDVIVPQIKSWISGPAGTVISCGLQMFFIAFIFPWCCKRLEKPYKLESVKRGGSV